MELDVVQLTQDLIAINSEGQRGGVEIADFLEEILIGLSFEVERLEGISAQGKSMASLVARKGEGSGGLGFFSHSDTVPASHWDRDPCQPVIRNGRLIGLGSCDMKGGLAATIVAAARIDDTRLESPLFIVISGEEEASFHAEQVVEQSAFFNAAPPKYGVVAEPTRLLPTYAHKGGGRVVVVAHGRAAHSSTEEGISSNFLIAPFLAEMAELVEVFKSDESFMNYEFSPPTNGFNMVLDDGGCRPNVTAAKTVCTLSFRTMPGDRRDDIVDMVVSRAEPRGFDVTSRIRPPFYVSPDAEIIQIAMKATGIEDPTTMPFGTEAAIYKDYTQLTILGPGDVAQAHTVGEWVEVEQLLKAPEVYARMIEMLCT